MNGIETTETTNWRELMVTDADGDSAGTLGDLVDNAPANLDNAVLNSDGSISEWMDFFIAASGEEADWDTPRAAVDWSGFVQALGR